MPRNLLSITDLQVMFRSLVPDDVMMLWEKGHGSDLHQVVVNSCWLPRADVILWSLDCNSHRLFARVLPKAFVHNAEVTSTNQTLNRNFTSRDIPARIQLDSCKIVYNPSWDLPPRPQEWCKDSAQGALMCRSTCRCELVHQAVG